MPRNLRLDPFIVLLLAMVVLATVLPARGDFADWIATATDAGIALLFFLHGAKLSRAEVIEGAGNLRLHALVLAMTFVIFPIVGVATAALAPEVVDPLLVSGIVFLTLLPSTVQSSIAFTSIARGNVPAAVCAASISNIAGMLVTPLLATWLLGTIDGQTDVLGGIRNIVLHLLVPFALGQASRPLIRHWIDARRKMIGKVDRTTILMVVYTAFGAAVVDGLWRTVGAADLAFVLVASAVMLAIVLAASDRLGRMAGLPRRDAIVLLFAGSKKSLATGVPIAGALFPAAAVGPIILPLLLFHQLQLIVCAVLASRFGRSADGASPDHRTT